MELSTKKKGLYSGALILSIILIDQIVKIYVKTHFYLGESVEVLSWFQIRFVENNGMAFGMELFSKLFLSIFRLIAIGAIGYYLFKIIKKQTHGLAYVLCIAALLAGAVGNIIDGVFYGVCFNSSAYQIASFLPEEGGYAPFFYGRVVDMLYFPMIDTILPDWIPFVGGSHFTFFDPVFNIADSVICVSMFYLLLFERNTLKLDFGESDKGDANNDKTDSSDEQK